VPLAARPTTIACQTLSNTLNRPPHFSPTTQTGDPWDDFRELVNMDMTLSLEVGFPDCESARRLGAASVSSAEHGRLVARPVACAVEFRSTKLSCEHVRAGRLTCRRATDKLRNIRGLRQAIERCVRTAPLPLSIKADGVFY
jgi:hypothetical protein